MKFATQTVPASPAPDDHKRPLTPLVARFAGFIRDGDVIPHGWNKHIGTWHEQRSRDGRMRRVWRSRPFACWLLARIVWAYTPSPVHNETGDVIGYRRKFRGPYWVINIDEIAAALGCSTRTIKEELSLLRDMGLVETRDATPRTGALRPRLYVIPDYDRIVAITPAHHLEQSVDDDDMGGNITNDPDAPPPDGSAPDTQTRPPAAGGETSPAASEETSPAASEETSPAASEETSPFLYTNTSPPPPPVPRTPDTADGRKTTDGGGGGGGGGGDAVLRILASYGVRRNRRTIALAERLAGMGEDAAEALINHEAGALKGDRTAHSLPAVLIARLEQADLNAPDRSAGVETVTGVFVEFSDA